MSAARVEEPQAMNAGKNAARPLAMTAGKNAARLAMLLLGLVLAGGALVYAAFHLTRERIEEAENREKFAIVNQILPANLYDNHVLQDSVKIAPNRLLGTNEATLAYRARSQGKPVAVILEAVAPDGYGGRIKLVIALFNGGQIAGVRVLAHNETPGWGDYIEIEKGPWIKVFAGKSAAGYAPVDWQVRKDGGKFDYVARATVTPRAVVKAVHSALQFYAARADELFAPHGRVIK